MRRLAVITGIAGPLAVVALTLLGGAFFPQYNHASQFISELGSADAPHGRLVSLAGFLPAGIFCSVFAFAAWRALPRSWAATLGLLGLFLFALGYLVAAFFPCEGDCRSALPGFSQAIHNFFGLAGYLTAPFTLWTLGVAARGWTRARLLSALGFVAGCTALLGLLFLSPDFRYVGVAQRLLEGSVLFWMASCAWYLRRTRFPGLH
ncbi:MAG: DUF998 domain-containing protein [Chthoniobacterales bacterium]